MSNWTRATKPAQLRACQSESELVAAGDYVVIGVFVAIVCPFCGTRAVGGHVTRKEPLSAALVECGNGERFTVTSGKVTRI